MGVYDGSIFEIFPTNNSDKRSKLLGRNIVDMSIECIRVAIVEESDTIIDRLDSRENKICIGNCVVWESWVVMEWERRWEITRSRMMSSLVWKSMCCWNHDISNDDIRFMYIAGTLGALYYARGSLKSPIPIFMLASKAEIVSMCKQRWLDIWNRCNRKHFTQCYSWLITCDLSTEGELRLIKKIVAAE